MQANCRALRLSDRRSDAHPFPAQRSTRLGAQVKIDRILGHGGCFKTPEVGQKIMAAAMNVPVSIMETAGATIAPGLRDVEGFNDCMERYKKGLVIERAAVEGLR